MDWRREECTGASASTKDSGDSSDGSACDCYHDGKEAEERQRISSSSASSLSSFWQRRVLFLPYAIVLSSALGGIGNEAGFGSAAGAIMLPVIPSFSKLEGSGRLVDGKLSSSASGSSGGVTRDRAQLLLDDDYHRGRVLSTTTTDFPLAGNDYEIGLETRTLKLGQERTYEKLPFRAGGRCVYELMDMKEAHWYELKISYPASTPAIFSIDLLPEHNEESPFSGRKLLNTEKVIFYLPETPASQDAQFGTKRRFLVSVKPEGFVAQPNVQEQEFIIYNILLEEVLLGIPVQAFWVGFLGLVAICATAFGARQIITHFQPMLQELASTSSKRAL